MNILVCDDEKEIVEAIAIYLEQEGYRVLKAYDGYQAMDIIEHNDIGCLIIDIMMPHLDGIHATMEIRKTRRKKKQCKDTYDYRTNEFLS